MTEKSVSPRTDAHLAHLEFVLTIEREARERAELERAEAREEANGLLAECESYKKERGQIEALAYQRAASACLDVGPWSRRSDDSEVQQHFHDAILALTPGSAAQELAGMRNAIETGDIAIARNKELEQELEGLRRDAERYRKARTMPLVLDHSRITPQRPDKFDALIDAAIQAGREGA